MTAKRTHFPVEIAGVKRRLPLFEVAPGLRIAILNILGDTALVQAAARQLGRKLAKLRYDVLVTAEAKSIPLVYALSVVTKKPYVVLRKTYATCKRLLLLPTRCSVFRSRPITTAHCWLCCTLRGLASM